MTENIARISSIRRVRSRDMSHISSARGSLNRNLQSAQIELMVSTIQKGTGMTVDMVMEACNIPRDLGKAVRDALLIEQRNRRISIERLSRGDISKINVYRDFQETNDDDE